LGEELGSVGAGDRVIRFYVDIGSFGDINSGISIFLPSGTIVSTGPNETGVLYRLVSSVILPLDENEMFVSVEAVRSGSVSNLGINQLVYHNFNDYTDSFNNSLKVTNLAEINTGQDVESDTNYRFRIANQVPSSEKANLTSVRLAALTVPGVADITLIPFFHGIGTYDILVKATTPNVSQSLLNIVTESVLKTTGQGLIANVRGPIEIGVSMTGTLTLRRAVSTTEESNVAAAVTANVTDYINNLDIAEDFIVNEVVERVMATSDIIKNVGRANLPLDRVFIHRPSSLEDNKIRSKLLGDFSPDVDEKLLVENRFAGATPILFRVA
jgi:hypothetical protein